MKCRLFWMLIAVMMVTKPAGAFLPVLTTDPMGIVQGVGKIKGGDDRLKESAATGKTLQKTMTSIGTAKKSVSDYITNAKKFIAEKKEKIEKYRQQAAKYKAKAEAAKKRAQQIKEKAQQAKDKAQEFKDKAQEAKDKMNKKGTKEPQEGTGENENKAEEPQKKPDENGYIIDENGNLVDEFGNIIKTKEEQQQQVNVLSNPQKIRLARASSHTSIPLAFADVWGDEDDDDDDGMRTGETKDGVLIVPESIAMSGVEKCDLDYKQAMEPQKMNDCLRAANALKYKLEGRDQQESEDMARNLENGLLEYYASSFFEAFNVYNETLTFKTNVYDPIVNQDINTIQEAWQYTKEMSQKLGDQINLLAKLWSRESASEIYKVYWDEGLGAYDEEGEGNSESKQG